MDSKTALELVKKYGTQAEAARQAKVSKDVIRRAILRADKGVKAESVKKSKPEKEVKARSLSAFREMYDKSYIVPQRVREALKALGNGWEYEVEFAKSAGVTLSDLSAYRDQFIDYIVQIGRDGRRAWAGSKGVAAQMRKMI